MGGGGGGGSGRRRGRGKWEEEEEGEVGGGVNDGRVGQGGVSRGIKEVSLRGGSIRRERKGGEKEMWTKRKRKVKDRTTKYQ